MFHTKRKRIPLKTVYYTSFLFLIVIPILVVLILALLFLNKQFKSQAIETIKRSHETIITELVSDINVMSMRLSHLIYTNNNEMLKYAAGTDTQDFSTRYSYEQKLYEAGNLALEPVKNIVSVGFYMKSGKETYIKNSISRSSKDIKESKWYQAALKHPNTVCVGSYDTTSANDLYTGGRKDLLILVFALAPDVTTDRSQKIEMVTFFQATGASDRIKRYNLSYQQGENKLGITQITSSEGVVFSTQDEDGITEKKKDYTKVVSPLKFNDTTWYIESYIKTSVLTEDYWDSAFIVLSVAVFVLLLSGYYSRYFLRSIVKPVEEISSGLRQVEEGNLEVHIVPNGQYELRTMIHQFNAMARRLKALIQEYEDRVRNVEMSPKDYFAALIKKETTPMEVNQKSKEFFMERYAILGFFIENYPMKENDNEYLIKLINSFERNPRFASRCILYIESISFLLVMYRITEVDYISKVTKMAEDIQRESQKEFGIEIHISISSETFGYADFTSQITNVRSKMCLRHLLGDHVIIDLNQYVEKQNKILELAKNYNRLAVALSIADEKNMVQEKEKLFELLNNMSMEESKLHIFAAILAIGNLFSMDNTSFSDVFGQKYNYIDKINRIEDLRNLKLWVTNYFAWIMDYSATKLNVTETDATIKAKRYIVDNYEDADLSLLKVAEYVGLNEKYFTSRFTKETGETFSSYLTEIRMQKAKDLLKNTNFKVYEISEMVGYHNVEHFNRMFKKINKVSPAQYRKGTT
ncbi:helix-turn-helix domain-containing protein [Lachnoclostridium phytofermentans]|uniref:helix-turn-helix domain-containing protein n=1 Tax=Lachnoclostridium phytofermentans TaxID=66219 RepID=UPI0004958039|nr:helix-turn-helix domain-containing protein [Lachnoclostridium phytofermentans]